MKRLLGYAFAGSLAFAGAAWAQEDDSDSGGLLVNFLENTLSNDSRNIEVVGLEGALSARATIERIVVSDDQGPWLTLEGAVLDWNRLALVRGRFSVNELSATRIEVSRRPEASTDPDLPSPEAQPFALPELPVSIEIGALQIGEVILGETVAGVAAELSVNGNLTLADGALDTLISANRLDAVGNALTLDASYSNETRQIGLDVTLTEGAQGLLVNLLNVPGRPPLVFTAKGDGPVEDFAADIALATDGVRRVGGQVALTGLASDDGSSSGIGFTADLSGDVTPLLEPAFHDFFGTRTALTVNGAQSADGGLNVDAFSLTSAALDLQGALALAPGGLPQMLDLSGGITPPEGGTVVLPFGQPAMSITGASVEAALDASQSDAFSVQVALDGFRQTDIALDRAEITIDGTLDQADPPTLNGTLEAALTNLLIGTPGVTEALGPDLTLAGAFDLPGDGTFSLSDVAVQSEGLTAEVSATIDGLDSGFDLTGTATVDVPDLTRFATLSGQDTAGQITAQLTGQGVPLGGSFDVTLAGEGRDLAIGVAEADALLAGATTLNVDLGRGAQGVVLRSFELSNPQMQANADGALRSLGTELAVTARINDMAVVVPEVAGPLVFDGTVQQSVTRNSAWSVEANLEASRDQAALEASHDLQTRETSFDLNLTEEADGLLGNLLNLPGRPALQLTAVGDGVPAEFGADLSLTADGVQRLTGRVDLTETGEGTEVANAVSAAIEGNLTPFLPEDFRDFFGTSTALQLEAALQSDGRVDLTRLDVASAALNLRGSGALNADRLPERVALTGTVAPPAGDTVVVPFLAPRTTIEGARVNATLNTATSEAWDLNLSVDGLEQPDAGLDRATLNGRGTLALEAPAVAGSLAMRLEGARLRGQDLSPALGPIVSLNSRFDYPGDGTLTIETLALNGEGYGMQADAVLRDLDAAPAVSGRARLTADDLSRFSVLAGQDLGGSVSANLVAEALLSGETFDVRLDAETQDVQAGISQVDALLAGTTEILIDAARGEGTLDLRQFRVSGAQVTASGQGQLADTGSALTLAAQLEDMAAVVPGFAGPLSLSAGVRQNTADDWEGRVRLDGPEQAFADVNGTLTENGGAAFAYTAELPRIERFVPEFPGTVTAEGSAERSDGVWTVALDAAGPAGITADVGGTYAETTGEADITAVGGFLLGAANRLLAPINVRGNAGFDLALKGQPGLPALSGQLTATDVDIAIPQIQNTITGFGGTIGLNAGQAQIDLAGNMRTGGGFRISGPVGMTAPFNGTVDLELLDLILTDQISYSTMLAGGLRFAGPMAGNGQLSGQINVGETEINIATAGGAPGTAPVPPITHIAEPSGSLTTRMRAGLVKEERPESEGGGGPAIGLDVGISMPNRVFVRGRGLESELGGAIQVGGTTANIVPTGSIELIRGHLGIFGRRLDLTKGIVTLQGTLEPFLDFAATSNTSEGPVSIEILGPLSSPEIDITSDPERPDEEALALLVFGNELAKLSPFQVAQLAAYIAQLQGTGSGAQGSLRRSLGLDSLDLTQDQDGNAAVEVGGYLSENVYSDVIVNTRGESEVTLNLDVTDSFTVRGSVDNEGETGLGVFFERDY